MHCGADSNYRSERSIAIKKKEQDATTISLQTLYLLLPLVDKWHHVIRTDME